MKRRLANIVERVWMDAWVILAIIVAIVVIAVLIFSVFKGWLGKVKFSATGVEIEGPAEKSSPPRTAITEESTKSTESTPATKKPWEDRVDIDHDVYFGRSEQNIGKLATLIQRGPSGSITSVRGEGGIGKTASTYEAIKESSNIYSMIAWSSFRQHQNPRSVERGVSIGRSFREVLRDLAQQLGLNINTADALVADQFAKAIKRISNEQTVLLVVDNLEKLSDVRSVVDYFVATSLLEHCHVTLTTRASATKASSVVHEQIIENLALQPSCDLIRHEARGSQQVSQADNVDLQPIHTVVDGNPYLMKLISRRLCYETRPLDQLLADIRKIDRADPDRTATAAIRDYMFTSSLRQLAILAGEASASALIHAFGSEPPGSRISYITLQQISELNDNKFHNTLDAAHDLSLVTKHGLNESFSIHSLLHSYTSGWSSHD